MSTSTAAVRASTSASSTPQFWERLWRTAGVQSVGLFVVAYFVYGNQPHADRKQPIRNQSGSPQSKCSGPTNWRLAMDSRLPGQLRNMQPR